jgi:hypothetical protein
MRKQIKRIAAALLATGMLLCAMPLAAFATDVTTDVTENGDPVTMGGYFPSENRYNFESNYRGTDGDSLTLTKCLKLDRCTESKTDVPYASCTFLLESANPRAGFDYSGWTAQSGFLTNGYEATKNVTFGPTDSEVTLTTSQGKTKACKDFTYKFGDMLTSTNPATKYKGGCVYCYKVTEKSATPGYIAMDDDNVRFVDVYVGYNAQENLCILKIISYRLVKKPFGFGCWKDYAYKNNCFNNNYCTTTLDLTKLITGNQCDKTKAFPFFVTIDTGVGKVNGADSLMKGYTMYISGSSGMTSPSTMTVGNDGTVTQQGTMTDKDNVLITNIPCGSEYKVTETADGYTVTIKTNMENYKPAKDFGGKKGTDGKISNCGTTLTFKNDKHGDVPTGVMLDVAPYALMVGLALAGLVGFTIRKRRVQ